MNTKPEPIIVSTMGSSPKAQVYTTRDFSALLNLRIKQEVLQRELLPGELMQFILEIEPSVSETMEEGITYTFEEIEQMLNNALERFNDDIV